MANHLSPSPHSLHPQLSASTINLQFPFIRLVPNMPSISIVLVVVIAAIGLQQQLHFVNAADLPYAGSLYNCGEKLTATATAKNGGTWDYEFKCKEGDECVSGTCMNCPAKMEKPEDAAYCTISPAMVKNCQYGLCEENYDLNKYCGKKFKKAIDGLYYYSNCEGGGDCKVSGKCSDGSKPIMTRCNKDNLEVKGGKCVGTEEACKGVECQKMDYKYQPQK